eukprot:scaffold234474_cov37-Prasinocladus_malaysianus.AAC.2
MHNNVQRCSGFRAEPWGPACSTTQLSNVIEACERVCRLPPSAGPKAKQPYAYISRVPIITSGSADVTSSGKLRAQNRTSILPCLRSASAPFGILWSNTLPVCTSHKASACNGRHLSIILDWKR